MFCFTRRYTSTLARARLPAMLFHLLQHDVTAIRFYFLLLRSRWKVQQIAQSKAFRYTGNEKISPGIEEDSDQVVAVLCFRVSRTGGALRKSKESLKSRWHECKPNFECVGGRPSIVSCWPALWILCLETESNILTLKRTCRTICSRNTWIISSFRCDAIAFLSQVEF